MNIKAIFTPEAIRVLEEESLKLKDELKEEAINESLQRRGKPVEVTASDVFRARRVFVKRRPLIKPRTDMILMFNFLVGFILLFWGLLYPLIRDSVGEVYISPESLFVVMIVILGLLLIALSLFMRFYVLKYNVKMELPQTMSAPLSHYSKGAGYSEHNIVSEPN